MCCNKLATTQYFLKKMCCGRKNKVANTCHHSFSPAIDSITKS